MKLCECNLSPDWCLNRGPPDYEAQVLEGPGIEVVMIKGALLRTCFSYAKFLLPRGAFRFYIEAWLCLAWRKCHD